MKQLYDNHENVIPLIWQGDSSDASPGYSSRASLYGVGGIPHTQFQGNIADVGGGSTYPRYLNYYNNTINTDSPIEIEMSLDFNAQGQLVVQGDILLHDDLTTADNRVVIAITRYINSDYFSSVAGYTTQTFPLSSAGETGSYSHAFTIEPNWNLGDLKGIVMVQSWQSKYIVQAAKTGFTGLMPFFSANVTDGPPTLGVQFIDYSLPAEGIESWEWDLNGDGNTDSTEQNPYFLYEQPGTYHVSLIITREGETQELIKENYIEVTAGANITGYVSGIWKEEWNPYIITDDITIQASDTLEIEQGVVIQANNGSTFHVSGMLQAVGEASNPIIFTSENTWKGIRFSYSNQANLIKNSRISNAIESAVYVNESSVEIIGNAFFDNFSPSNAGAIELTGSDNVLIKQNFITNNSSNSATGGIGSTASSPLISNNIIVNNQADPTMPATAGAFVLKSGSNATIINNTVSNNLASNAIFVINSEPVINNSIIMHNGQILYDIVSLVTVNYSCISGNYIGMGNIDVDPLFVHASGGDGVDFSGFGGEWYLQEQSQAIDAGNPEAVYNDVEDPDNPGNPLWPAMGTLRNDMGAFGGFGFPNYYQFTSAQEQNIPAVNKIAISIYPNPFNPETNISLQLPDEMLTSTSTISIYNLRGQLVRKLAENELLKQDATYKWSGKNLHGNEVASGVYFVTVTTGKQSFSKKMMLLK